MPKSETVDRTRLMKYLNDLKFSFCPVDIDIAGRWVGGNEELYHFCKELMEEIERWE